MTGVGVHHTTTTTTHRPAPARAAGGTRLFLAGRGGDTPNDVFFSREPETCGPIENDPARRSMIWVGMPKKPTDTGPRPRARGKPAGATGSDAPAPIRLLRPGPPDPPDWLSAEAAAVWRRAIAAKPDADPDALCVYACAVADYAQAQRVLDRSGPLIEGAKGLVRNPLQSVKTANAAIVRSLGRELGLIEGGEPETKRRWRNQRAVEATIAALRVAGQIEPQDEVLLALLRTIGSALDTIEVDEAPAALASLARVQVSAITVLRGRTNDDADALAALLASLSAEMGDAPES